MLTKSTYESTLRLADRPGMEEQSSVVEQTIARSARGSNAGVKMQRAMDKSLGLMADTREASNKSYAPTTSDAPQTRPNTAVYSSSAPRGRPVKPDTDAAVADALGWTDTDVAVAATMRSLQEQGSTAEQVRKEATSTGTTMPTGYQITDFAAKVFEEKGVDVGALMRAVRLAESSNNYSSRGKVIKSGMYKGERAMGAYQVMPGNLPSWSKQALGKTITVEEFMNTPEYQDAIFIDQISRSVKKFGNLRDAVSTWFTGDTYAEAVARGARDQLTTVENYIEKFERYYDKELGGNNG